MESCQVGFDGFFHDKGVLALPGVPVKTSVRWLFNVFVWMRCAHRRQVYDHMVTLFDSLDLEFPQCPPLWVAQGGETHSRQRRTKTHNHVIVIERHDQQWKNVRTQEHSCKKLRAYVFTKTKSSSSNLTGELTVLQCTVDVVTCLIDKKYRMKNRCLLKCRHVQNKHVLKAIDYDMIIISSLYECAHPHGTPLVFLTVRRICSAKLEDKQCPAWHTSRDAKFMEGYVILPSSSYAC